MHCLRVTAPDLPGEDAFARTRSDVNAQQPGCRAAQPDDLDNPRQRWNECSQTLDLGVGEATGLARRPARRMNLAIGEVKRNADVVGDILSLHLHQEWRIGGNVRISQAPPNFLTGAVKDRQWARKKIV